MQLKHDNSSDMTIAVDWDIKQQIKYYKMIRDNNEIFIEIVQFEVNKVIKRLYIKKNLTFMLISYEVN